LKLLAGPTVPNPGPAPAMQVATDEKEVIKSILKKSKIDVPINTTIKYKRIKLRIDFTFSNSMNLLLILIEYILLVKNEERIEILRLLNKTTYRKTLIPPEVDPVEPPINSANNIKLWATNGHLRKSSVAKPVQVIIETN
jgi:hypothetical protein